jgi:hypothetical protein
MKRGVNGETRQKEGKWRKRQEGAGNRLDGMLHLLSFKAEDKVAKRRDKEAEVDVAAR